MTGARFLAQLRQANPERSARSTDSHRRVPIGVPLSITPYDREEVARLARCFHSNGLSQVGTVMQDLSEGTDRQVGAALRVIRQWHAGADFPVPLKRRPIDVI